MRAGQRRQPAAPLLAHDGRVGTRDEIDDLKTELAQPRKDLAKLKAAAPKPEMLLKTDPKERIVLGWAYVARDAQGKQSWIIRATSWIPPSGWRRLSTPPTDSGVTRTGRNRDRDRR